MSAWSALRLTVSPQVGPTVLMLTSLTFDARVLRRARRATVGQRARRAASSDVTVTFWPSTVTVGVRVARVAASAFSTRVLASTVSLLARRRT